MLLVVALSWYANSLQYLSQAMNSTGGLFSFSFTSVILVYRHVRLVVYFVSHYRDFSLSYVFMYYSLSLLFLKF